MAGLAARLQLAVASSLLLAVFSSTSLSSKAAASRDLLWSTGFPFCRCSLTGSQVWPVKLVFENATDVAGSPNVALNFKFVSQGPPAADGVAATNRTLECHASTATARIHNIIFDARPACSSEVVSVVVNGQRLPRGTSGWRWEAQSSSNVSAAILKVWPANAGGLTGTSAIGKTVQIVVRRGQCDSIATLAAAPGLAAFSLLDANKRCCSITQDSTGWNMPLVHILTASSNYQRHIDLAFSGEQNGNLFHEWEYNGTPAQEMAVEHVSGQWHRIKHALSGKCFQLDDTRLHIWDCEEGDDTQLFSFSVFGNGHRIIVKATLQCLDVETDGEWFVNVFKQQPCADVADQGFRVQELD